MRRAGAFRVVRHRSRPLRDARRARLHAPRQDPQIRGRLSRDERLFADEPGAEALGQFPAAGAGFGRHPEKRARRHDHRAVQRRRRGIGSGARAQKRSRRRHRRAIPTDHPARPRLFAGFAQDHAGKRRAADIRRSRDRLPPRLWRRAGILRRRPRSVHAGESDRRRLSSGGDRRQGRDHGAFRQEQGRRRKLPRADRHIVRQPGRRRRGPCDDGDPEAPRRLRAYPRHRAAS